MKREMKKQPLLLFALLFNIGVNAQEFEWAKTTGGTSNDFAIASSVDASGNLYVTGYFQGTVDFDPGTGVSQLTSNGGSDVFVQKLDASGNFIWAKSFGGNSYDYVESIVVDDAGNVYTTGSFQGTADFDPGAGTASLNSAGFSDIFVQKLDVSGNLLWVKSFGSNDFDSGNSIAIDASGSVYTTGYFQGTVDFDPGTATSNLTTVGYYDVFIQKLDASGNFQWAKSFGGGISDVGHSITTDASGNIYTTGIFGETVDFDPGTGSANLSSSGDFDVFVQKLDNNGTFLWAKSFGGSSGENVESISVDASGNVFTTGHFQGTADFDPISGSAIFASAGGSDVFVHKIDASGNFLWVKTFGGSNYDYGQSITVDTYGNVYTLGNFAEMVDFDPGASTVELTSAGSVDVFIQKLDASGNFLWAKSFGGSIDDFGNSITIDASGNLYTTGYFQGTADLDPGIGSASFTSVGASDVFVQKLSQCIPNTGTDVQSSCNSYTWPLNNVTYTSSTNTPTVTLTNATGCDSIVTLNLTINSVSDISTSLNQLTITANNSTASYQWLDCDNNYAEINGETNQTFTPSINGNYAVELTENGCVDTSDCVAIASVGITESDFANTLKVYPNPTSGDFTIDLGTLLDRAHIVINDISGRLIQSQQILDAQKLNLTIANPPGIYFLTIQAGNNHTVLRLVKE